MKIHIPAYEPSLECTERLRHGEIDIDLGEDVVRVVFCRDCKYCEEWGKSIWCDKHKVFMSMKPTDFCSYGERKDKV